MYPSNYARTAVLILPLTIFLTSCTPQPTKDVPAEFQRGQKLFHKICSNCHGADAMGKQSKAPRLIDEDFLPGNFPDQEIRETIINGTDKMPSQRRKIKDAEIKEVIKYLRYSQKAADLVDEDEIDEESIEEDVEEEPTKSS